MSRISNKAYILDTKCPHGYWLDRILYQIKYAIGLSDIRDGQYDELIERVEDFLLDHWKANKNISPEAARQAEALLSPLSEDAKSFTLHCVAHAHIDMNWMWRFDETVSVALDTFRTMLDLLREYPQFTYAQSQASVYQIVEEFGPDGMLEEIKKYVKEGRWEVSASTWVEADKNMPSGESMARRYLSKLLDIPMESIRIDFEPDTFGHSANVPEVLADAGIEYYYHCRGSLDPQILWWQSPSGKRVLTVRDATFYNSTIDASITNLMMERCKQSGVDTMLKVYGVGDHGGGPSRRDIENILDMQTWPVYPTILFSTYGAYFDDVKKRFGDKLPVRTEEMNPIFSGCYTTQSRIKMANRIGEGTLYEAELFGALAAGKAGYHYKNGAFETAWKHILFNQFHDILTGSGTVETREYAMGIFQRSFATANTERLNALRAIASRIDSSRFIVEEDKSQYRNEGAGVGGAVYEYKISQVDRGCGSVRVYHVFNPSPYDREGMAEISVWDWGNAELPLAEFRDEQGRVVPHQLLKFGVESYWQHEYMVALIPVKVPAGGYATYTLHVSEDNIVGHVYQDPFDLQLMDAPFEYILENALVRVVLDTKTAHIVSYIDKRTGKEWIRPGEYGGFRLVDEDPHRGMTSWRVGRHMKIYDFDSVHIKPMYYDGARLRQVVHIEGRWSRSSVRATISLEENSTNLIISAECDWNENSVLFDRIPQLSFSLPLNGEYDEFCYDIPFGTIVRKAADQDLPGTSFISTVPDGQTEGFMLSSNYKYGYRGFDNTLSVALIRMSYDPDPTPEYGRHRFQLAIGPSGASRQALVRHAFDLWHPFDTIAEPAHKGELPLSDSLFALEGDEVVLQAVKLAEDSRSLIVRLYDATNEAGGKAVLRLGIPVGEKAVLTDLHERPEGEALPVDNGTLSVEIGSGSVASLMVPLK